MIENPEDVVFGIRVIMKALKLPDWFLRNLETLMRSGYTIIAEMLGIDYI